MNLGLRVAAVLGVGFIILIGTVLGFNTAYQSTAPTVADIDRCVAAGDPQCVQRVFAASEQAGGIRNSFYLILGVEILTIVAALVIVILQARERKP